MTFKEWTDSIRERVKNGLSQGGNGEPEMESNMANGGFSGYRPNQAKGRDIFSTQSVPAQQPQENQQAAPEHTGFTGMFPGMGAQGGFTATFAQPQSYPPQQEAPQGYPPFGQGQDPFSQYTAGVGGFQPMGNTGYQPGFVPQPPQGTQTAWQPVGGPMGGYQQPTGQTAWQQPIPAQPQGYPPPQQPQQNPAPTGRTFRMRAQREQPQQSAPDNILYMPKNFVGTDGKAYNHVERITQLVSVSACFRIIEFMRNGESVIVNTESIANEADAQRCLDMLAGAAFTLGCSLTKITQVKRAYLIAPLNVLVMQDVGVSRWSDRDSVQQPPEPDAAEARERYRPERGVYAPDRRWEQQEQEPFRTGTFQPQQQVDSRRQGYQAAEQTGRTQPRAAYDSDTRRGFYGTPRRPANGEQGFGGFGQ